MLYNILYHSYEKCSEQRNNFKGRIFYVRHVIYGKEHDKSPLLGWVGILLWCPALFKSITFISLICVLKIPRQCCVTSDDFQQQTTQHKNLCEAVTCYHTYYSIMLGKISLCTSHSVVPSLTCMLKMRCRPTCMDHLHILTVKLSPAPTKKKFFSYPRTQWKQSHFWCGNAPQPQNQGCCCEVHPCHDLCPWPNATGTLYAFALATADKLHHLTGRQVASQVVT